jgi:hypothetical protein
MEKKMTRSTLGEILVILTLYKVTRHLVTTQKSHIIVRYLPLKGINEYPGTLTDQRKQKLKKTKLFPGQKHTHKYINYLPLKKYK